MVDGSFFENGSILPNPSGMCCERRDPRISTLTRLERCVERCSE
jgi:hypothetical protein